MTKVMDTPRALAADMNGAAARLSQAMAAKNALLNSAAAGKAVSAQELRAAEEAVRGAELDATLAAEVGKHTTAERQRAQIEQRQAEADALAGRMAALAREHLAAAVALDAAMAAAREAAATLDAARRAIEETDGAAHQHNEMLKADARANAILASQHSSVWPKARVIAAMPIQFGFALRPELVTFNRNPAPLGGTGGRDEVVRRTAEQIARSACPLPIVSPRAA